jgi:hypothetical protein
VYEFVSSLDSALDLIVWGWEGAWTERLELSLVELVVAVSDDLVALVRSWKPLLSSFSDGGGG